MQQLRAGALPHLASAAPQGRWPTAGQYRKRMSSSLNCSSLRQVQFQALHFYLEKTRLVTLNFEQ